MCVCARACLLLEINLREEGNIYRKSKNRNTFDFALPPVDVALARALKGFAHPSPSLPLSNPEKRKGPLPLLHLAPPETSVLGSAECGRRACELFCFGCLSNSLVSPKRAPEKRKEPILRLRIQTVRFYHFTLHNCSRR